MTFFLSKKQKALMRQRRRKKRKASEGQAASLAEKPADSEDLSSRTSNDDDKVSTQTILIPAHLSGMEAKKFRKEARRKARSEGRDASLLDFIADNNGCAKQQEDGEPPSKKRKRSFPKINELLQQQKEEQLKQQEEAKRKEADAKLPHQIKERYVALDCEMVGIGSGGKRSALARVSLVDWYGKEILDTFVQVPTRVTDFRTHVSGVTAHHLHTDAMELHKCRQLVAKELRDKVLVGHALKNDLQALFLDHPKQDIRDTAKYRPFQRASGRNGGKWRPRKLRDLVKEFLSKDIQVDGESHDSVEDARSAMELFQHVREEWEKELKEKHTMRRK